MMKFFSVIVSNLLCLAATGTIAQADPPKNVIFMIGDGMGFEQVKAAGMYLHGEPGTLSFEQFPFQAEVTTHSADSSITDSAAAATAIATGQKVNNGVIGLGRGKTDLNSPTQHDALVRMPHACLCVAQRCSK